MQTQGYALDTTRRTLFKDLGVVPANVLWRAVSRTKLPKRTP
jgi:hypothetical protein